MFAQAAGFAVLAAISPTALLVMAVFLGSANPRSTALLYVIGAMLMTAAMAVTVLVVLRTTGLNQPHQHDARYGLRLGVGALALATAAVVVARRRRPGPPAATPAPAAAAPGPAPGTSGPGLVSRLVAEPQPRTAFAVGVLLFAPGATFIAAVQVVATADASAAATTLALLIVVIITGLTVWLPLLTYLAAPEATTRRLRALNGWLRANGRVLLMGALVVCGIALVISGSAGLAGG